MQMKKDYQSQYKDQKRVVIYIEDPSVKAKLIQMATDKGISLSKLLNPIVKKFADAAK